jgi:hypothetical protein
MLPYQASARSAGILKMPQLQLPMFPVGVTHITALLAFINLKKSVEFNPAENIQHKFDKLIGGMS